MPDRKANFERALTDYDERSLRGAVDFAAHRFVSVERDNATGDTYVKGHRSLRQACDHMASAVASDGVTPRFVVDLDRDELIELDVFTFVAPASMDAVAVMMPRSTAALAAANLEPTPENLPAIEFLKHAIDRRA